MSSCKHKRTTRTRTQSKKVDGYMIKCTDCGEILRYEEYDR